MTKEQIIEFINANPAFALATLDGNQPRARYMMTSFADERGIIFCTGKSKEVYLQLSNNPAVELCYCDAGNEMQIRVEAVVEELDDLDLKKAVVERFEFLKPWVDELGYDVMHPFQESAGMDFAVYKQRYKDMLKRWTVEDIRAKDEDDWPQDA